MQCPSKSSLIFALSEEDLPVSTPVDLTEISEESFNLIYGEVPKVYRKSLLKRIYITLPLKLRSKEDKNKQKVIPIPFIVDTGAPLMLILGKGAKDILMSKGLLTHPGTGNYANQTILKGDLCYKSNVIKQPLVVNSWPSTYNLGKVEDNVQANLLGLKALFLLKIDLCFSAEVQVLNNLRQKL